MISDCALAMVVIGVQYLASMGLGVLSLSMQAKHADKIISTGLTRRRWCCRYMPWLPWGWLATQHAAEASQEMPLLPTAGLVVIGSQAQPICLARVLLGRMYT